MAASKRRSETAPLLRRTTSTAQAAREMAVKTLRPAVLCILLVKFLTTFAHYHLFAPKLHLLELALCRGYYASRQPSAISTSPAWPGFHIQEELCKESGIQQDLSNLRSWNVLFEGLCTLLLSIPYGYLADRYGRKLTFSLSVTGLILGNLWFVIVCTFPDIFPIPAVLASSCFLVIGGGVSVLLAIVITMAIDLTAEKSRSTVLYWLLAMYQLGYSSGTGVTTLTMQTGPAPFFLSLAVILVALGVVLYMPETNNMKQAQKLDTVEDSSDDDDSERDFEQSPNRGSMFEKSLNVLRPSMPLTKNLMMVLGAFPLLATRFPISELSLPYVSMRYGWPLAKAGLLDAWSGAVGLLLGAVLLPVIAVALTNRGFQAIQADLTVARYSALSLSIGALVVAIAPNVWAMVVGYSIHALGFGARMSTLAVAVSLVAPDQVARINTMILTSETMADLTFSPLIWRLWSAGLALNGSALGLPWFVVAATLFLAAVLLFMVSIRTLIAASDRTSASV